MNKMILFATCMLLPNLAGAMQPAEVRSQIEEFQSTTATTMATMQRLLTENSKPNLTSLIEFSVDHNLKQKAVKMCSDKAREVESSMDSSEVERTQRFVQDLRNPHGNTVGRVFSEMRSDSRYISNKACDVMVAEMEQMKKELEKSGRND